MFIQAELESEDFHLHAMTVSVDDTDDDQGVCLQTAVMRMLSKHQCEWFRVTVFSHRISSAFYLAKAERMTEAAKRLFLLLITHRFSCDDQNMFWLSKMLRPTVVEI